ncbi:MAG: hypothetical protein J5590_07380 [Clostridia bacterium]|nr:hypothetical protein [Clostridia bacterium]
MRKRIVFSFIIIIIFVVIFFGYKVWFAPVKYAVSQEDLLNSKEQYYLVQWVQVTGSSWMIVGDQNGYYEHGKYIVAKGEVPSVVENYSIATGHNTYICYGEYCGKTDIGGGDILETYQFSGWDILYPVKRNGLIPFLPKKFLCKMDFR